MRARTLTRIAPILAAVLLLPLRSDGGPAECFNATGSLAASVNDPVSADESFFKLPTGPANVMLLLDTSGSMLNLPQCSDYTWNDSSAPATCKSPTLTAPSLTGSAKQASGGTCTPSVASSVSPATAALKWMENVIPQTTLADPGRSNALLIDNPSWGATKCMSGGKFTNTCLFDPNAYYVMDSWSVSSTSASATRVAHDTDTSFAAKGCILLDSSNNPIKDQNNTLVSLGSDCTTCMTNHGFYFYAVKYKNSGGTTKTATGLQVKGTFFNANPPKFVSSRKVVKDVAWMDPAVSSKLDQVRLGLSVTDSAGTSPRKAQLIVPLGPDKTNAYSSPPSQQKFRQARQYILSVLNGDSTSYYADTDGNITTTASTTVVVDGSAAGVQGGFFNPANGSTPLASALFNVGQYFTSSGVYATKFGSTYVTTEFAETSSGRVHAPWAASNACSICWACQTNSVILITDGSPNSEISLPTAITGYDNTVYVLPQNCGSNGANCVSPSDSTKSNLPRVADWLNNNDLRDDKVMSKMQTLKTFTIGINIGTASSTNKAATILQATANMGEGLYQNAEDAQTLASAVYNALNAVTPRESSFSAASANSLQTVQTAASEAYLTRFKPNQSITWEGHVFEGLLFDEFLNGCDPSLMPEEQPTVQCLGKTQSASYNGVLGANGKAACTGVYLVDQDCDEIAEDSFGNFLKKGAATPANFPWDAGEVLSDPTKTGYRSADETAAKARTIFTWINGQRVEFTAANVAVLKPLMNIDSAWCSGFLTRVSLTAGTDPTTDCAKQVIYFVRGWDVLDQDNDHCYGPGRTNATTCQRGVSGEERDRVSDSNAKDEDKIFWKLGDVFHSSPAVLVAPVDELRCDTGYEKQCIPTLHSPQGLGGTMPDGVTSKQTDIATYTVNGSDVDAYEAYRQANLDRRRVIMVGANDGMLHAFDAGVPDTSKAPDISGSRPYTAGTGEELWAFIPPDLLPKLKGLLDAHQYMVDGSVMLREVWVDGSTASDAATSPYSSVASKSISLGSANQTKEKQEYHTVAVFGRRSGGNQYSALDVTDPMKPTYLWNFPKAGSDDRLYMGQSWADFAPRPPPMGPVMLKSNAPRGFDERWGVFINGGYDPTLSKGRAVFLLDAWTGNTLWRFTDTDFKTQMGFSLTDPAAPSMFPVPAAVGPLDIGDTTTSIQDVDGFFDTATWGDMGGNLWVARFQSPGVIDGTTGRVNNWFVARAFEEQRQSSGVQNVAGRSEFFYMTANVFDPSTKTLRTYLGNGDREQLIGKQDVPETPTCGADHLFACCQMGCTKVTASTTDNYSGCTTTNTFACVNGQLQYQKTQSGTCGTTLSCSASPAFTSNVALHWECPGATASDSTGSVSCDATGLCTVTPIGSRGINGTFTTPPHNRFYGVWSYGGSDRRMFSDQASARTFDGYRFTDVAYSATCSGPTGNKCTLVDVTHAKVSFDASTPYAVTTGCDDGSAGCVAQVGDPGWFYEYGQTCPLSSCTPLPPWNGEKTGSGATVIMGCALWSGYRPPGAGSGGSDPCSGDMGASTTYGYVSNYMSGAPTSSCGYIGSGSSGTQTITRAARQSITASPSAATVRVTVNAQGQVSYSGLQINAGATPANIKAGPTQSNVSQPIYWLEIPRQVESCRHKDIRSCK